jgi:predicted nucleotidyltransferase
MTMTLKKNFPWHNETMSEIKLEKIQRVADAIAEKYRPEKIILFGSYAWGNPGPDSDVDLFIVKNTAKTHFEREQEIRQLLSPSGIAMDVFVYTPLELEQSINRNRNLFIEDIVRNGKVLFTKPGYASPTLRRPAELVQ